MTSLSLQDQMFLKRASKNLPDNEIDTVDEATFKLNPKKKGMWKGKSEADISKAKTKAKKSGNVTKEREAVFALNAKKGKFHKESEELFDENQPKFAKDGDALAAAKQGWGKKQLGKEGGTSGTSAGEAAAQGHGKRAVTGQLDREETEMENAQVVEDGDAKGQGTHATGKETLGPVRIKADGSAGEAAEQGHGKKSVRGEIYRDGHESSSGELGALEGKGKTPIRGEICREDVQDILAAIMDDKPGEAYDAFTSAIAPLVFTYTEAFKEHIQGGLLGVEEDLSDVEYDDDDELEVEDDDSQNEDEELEDGEYEIETTDEDENDEELDEEDQLDEMKRGERYSKKYRGTVNFNDKGEPASDQDRATMAGRGKGHELKYRGGERKYWGGGSSKRGANRADIYDRSDRVRNPRN